MLAPTSRGPDRAKLRDRIDTAAIRRIGLALPLMLLALVVLVTAFFRSLDAAAPDAPGTEAPLSALLTAAEAGEIDEARLLDHDGRVAYELSGEPAWSAYPASDAATEKLLTTLGDGGATIVVDQQNGKGQALFLAQFVLPLLLLANLFGLLFVMGRSGGARDLLAFSKLFGKKGKGDDVGRITFGHVQGADAAVTELREVVDYLKDPSRFAGIGALPPKGVLLVGPPGTGKTLLARAVAGEADVAFFSISGSEFVESLVGVGAARVRDLFRQAKGVGRAIIFIDELDAAGRRRGAGVGGGHDEREQTLNELLVQMDGFSPSAGIVVMGATNRPDILDPALLRPGRFDRKVTIDLPDVDGRAAILQLHAATKRLDAGVDLREVARRTPGFSGADLANLLNEAALLAVRERRGQVELPHLNEAVERVLAGPRTTAHRLEPDELRRVAYHEAGHALVAAATRGTDGLDKVTIVSRGRHVGHLEVLQRSDATVRSRSTLLTELVVGMAGVAAEELVFDEPSTAGEGDLERATELARRMVARYGMSEVVGRVQVLEAEEEVFLGRDYLASQHISPSILELVDDEVRRLLDEAEQEAERILRAGAEQLDALAEALLEHEVLEGDDLAGFLVAARAVPRKAATTATKAAKGTKTTRSTSGTRKA